MDHKWVEYYPFQTLVVRPITTGYSFGYNQAAWYLVPLFMVEVGNVLVRKGIKKLGIKIVPEIIYFIVSFIVGMGGVYMASIGYREGWWLNEQILATKYMKYVKKI